MTHWTTGAFPRNTSNGDYGKFLFALNQNNGSQSKGGYFSTDGNRMMQHVHYPNCPNRHASMNGGGGGGMPEYTIEYGEDAVRKVMGGNMPDFQAQFQQQYGNGSGDGNKLDPQAIQMMNNGKSKVAMIPVVFSEEGNEGSVDTAPDNSAEVKQDPSCVPQENSTSPGDSGLGESVAPAAQSAEENSPPLGNSEPPVTEAPPSRQKPPRPEHLLNTFDSIRKMRSGNQVKCGRHVRPSYWGPDISNPCRKKMGPGGDYSQPAESMKQQPVDDNANYMMPNPSTNPPMMMNQFNDGTTIMMANPYTGDYESFNPQIQMPDAAPKQRARSAPPRKPSRPTFSLCGKCQKCKNLGSDNTQPPILTYPKYSTGTMNGPSSQNRKLTTSSQLGQSAKNFRAIRFSSHN